MAQIFSFRTNSSARETFGVAETDSIPTNNVNDSSAAPVLSIKTDLALESSQRSTNSPLALTNSLPVPHPASDLLTVTPQMFIEYLKPVSETNQTEIVVPADVQFTPPTPDVPAGSRAIYKTQ